MHPGPGPRRVLVVDDDEGIRELIVSALSEEGYDVASAADGSEALTLLDSYEPGVILLDMRMPGMDGWQFARAYRSRPGRHAPIVICTAALDVQREASDIGAEGFLGKPFQLEDLLNAVEHQTRPS
ncbi:MAG TPA: response regulator [Candidatus Limnocylindria bacterium]